ncbi:MAG: TetR/AcrR family transcriptional regulator [Oceanicoccus sp.]
MSRPIEFERAHAVEAAMLLFWRQGYTATSLAQLLESMHIGRSSFYAAFGDKRSLFIEALSLFSARTNSIFDDVRAEEDPMMAINQFFEKTLFDVPERRMRRGCMMVNTVLELDQVDQGLSELAGEKLAEIETKFENCFRVAALCGNLSTQQDPRKLAQFMMTINQGLRVASRKKTDKKQLVDILKTTLSLLDMAA